MRLGAVLLQPSLLRSAAATWHAAEPVALGAEDAHWLPCQTAAGIAGQWVGRLAVQSGCPWQLAGGCCRCACGQVPPCCSSGFNGVQQPHGVLGLLCHVFGRTSTVATVPDAAVTKPTSATGGEGAAWLPLGSRQVATARVCLWPAATVLQLSWQWCPAATWGGGGAVLWRSGCRNGKVAGVPDRWHSDSQLVGH